MAASSRGHFYRAGIWFIESDLTQMEKPTGDFTTEIGGEEEKPLLSTAGMTLLEFLRTAPLGELSLPERDRADILREIDPCA